MRCELIQMDRMAVYDRFLEQEADAALRRMEMSRRMRREAHEREEEGIETLGDLLGDCGA